MQNIHRIDKTHRIVTKYKNTFLKTEDYSARILMYGFA
jgi:hypothetical protein